jgi:hypothetical protein
VAPARRQVFTSVRAGTVDNVVMRVASLIAFASLLTACGGSGGSASPSPAASATPTPVLSNPCTAALAAQPDFAPAAASARAKDASFLGYDQRDWRDLLWSHRTAMADGRARAESGRAAATADVGDIAVIQDDGSLILPANTFDLAGQGLRFSRNAAGGYDVSHTDATFRPNLGTRLSLADDDTSPAAIPFAFPFYGRGYTGLFVNSDGNITFERADTAQDERGIARLLSGPARVGSFFADLDPSAGGGVFVASGPDAVTVTWCSVRGFDSTSTVTSQATLLPDGSVEVKFGNVSLGAGIVALSPGATTGFASVDLHASGPTAGGAAAVGERFASTPDLDLITTARTFYRGHSDSYDQLVVWTDTGVVTDSFAFESTVQNAIQGIGVDTFDGSRDLGSGGQLESLVLMDNLGKYPADPAARVASIGENTTLSLLGQESGHRWLATLLFKDASGASSDLLLGRQRAHWSFFFDSDASVMEGNDIEDLGGGSFRTTATVQRYSLLDLYAMGQVDASEVPPLFFVEGASGLSQTRDSAPRTGVSFTGRRHDLTVDDIVAAMGPRRPSPNQAPHVHRQAFIYVVGRGRAADSAATDKLERIRSAWEGFFAAATGGRMTLDARLR